MGMIQINKREDLEEKLKEIKNRIDNNNEDLDSYIDLLSTSILAYASNYLDKTRENYYTGIFGPYAIDFGLQKDKEPFSMRVSLLKAEGEENRKVYQINVGILPIPSGFKIPATVIRINELNNTDKPLFQKIVNKKYALRFSFPGIPRFPEYN